MARKRMIDPSIWTDEGLATLSPRQQLLYIGLFCNADDDGRLRGNPVAVRLMLPGIFFGVRQEEVEADLEAVLGQMRKLVRYEHDGNTYLCFRNYDRWQHINRPTRSNLPPPPDDDVSDTPFDPPPHGSLNGTSVSDPAEEKGREERGEEGKGSDNGRVAAPARDKPDPLVRRAPEEIATYDPAAFARLWKYYGKLGNCARAAREWDALKPNRALMEAIKAAIDKQREAFRWGQPGGQAQPHLSTWLHGQEWHTEPIPNKVEASG